MGSAADLLSDDAVEAFFSGLPGAAWERDAALVAVDRQLAVVVDGPAPEVGPALARLMAGEPARAAFQQPARRPRRRFVALVAGLAAASAVPVAAAANVLPGPVHQAVVRVVEAVTPYEFPVRNVHAPQGGPGSAPPATAPASPPGADGHPTPAPPATGAPGITGDLPQGPPASLPPAAQAGTRPAPPTSGPPASLPPQVTSPQPPVTPPARGGPRS